MSPRHDMHGRCLKAPLEQRIVGRDQYAVLSRLGALCPGCMRWPMWAYMLCWAGDSGGTMYRHDMQVTVRKIYFGNL